MTWDFMTSRPETTHQLLRLFSDVGIPDGYRHMDGFGANTYKMVNATGNAVYVKFHYLVSSTSILSLKSIVYIYICTYHHSHLSVSIVPEPSTQMLEY